LHQIFWDRPHPYARLQKTRCSFLVSVCTSMLSASSFDETETNSKTSCYCLIATWSAFLMAILRPWEFIIGPAELRTKLGGVAWHYDVDRRTDGNVALRRSGACPWVIAGWAMRLSAGSCDTGSKRVAILRHSVMLECRINYRDLTDWLVMSVCSWTQGISGSNLGRIIVVFISFFFRVSPDKFQYIASDYSLSF